MAFNEAGAVSVVVQMLSPYLRQQVLGFELMAQLDQTDQFWAQQGISIEARRKIYQQALNQLSPEVRSLVLLATAAFWRRFGLGMAQDQRVNVTDLRAGSGLDLPPALVNHPLMQAVAAALDDEPYTMAVPVLQQQLNALVQLPDTDLETLGAMLRVLAGLTLGTPDGEVSGRRLAMQITAGLVDKNVRARLRLVADLPTVGASYTDIQARMRPRPRKVTTPQLLESLMPHMLLSYEPPSPPALTEDDDPAYVAEVMGERSRQGWFEHPEREAEPSPHWGYLDRWFGGLDPSLTVPERKRVTAILVRTALDRCATEGINEDGNLWQLALRSADVFQHMADADLMPHEALWSVDWMPWSPPVDWVHFMNIWHERIEEVILEARRFSHPVDARRAARDPRDQRLAAVMHMATRLWDEEYRPRPMNLLWNEVMAESHDEWRRLAASRIAATLAVR